MNAMRTAARLRALRAQAAAASLVDMGRALGLFARLAGLAPAPRAELAAVACVDERWLGDWLDGLVVAGLVDHDGARATYRLDAALAIDDDVDELLFAAARAACPAVAEGALLVNVGADALGAVRATRARLAAGQEMAVAVIDAAARVSDNLDHPLGAALYVRSLAHRAHGRGGVVDEHTLLRAFADAGLSDVRVHRERTAAGTILVVVGRA
jgi:hypothetical protein